jgi:hypothetical protein
MDKHDASKNYGSLPRTFDIKKKIFELEQDRFVTPEFFRAYTKALLRAFNDVRILDGEGKLKEVPIWYGNAERAIAKIYEGRNLNLPAMTVTIQTIDEDTDRRRPDFNIEFRTHYDTKHKLAQRYAWTAPKAVTLTFNINLWAKYLEDMNQLVEYLQLKFRPHYRVQTPFNDYTPAFLGAISDNSAYEAPDTEERILKKSASITLDTYVPSRQYLIASNGDIELFNFDVEIEEVNDGTTYESLVTSGNE